MKTESVQGGSATRVLWLVERPEFAEFLNLAIPLQMTASVKVRVFERPEPALQALEHCEEPPDHTYFPRPSFPLQELSLFLTRA